MPKPLNIFISYAHDDAPFKDQLLGHLAFLQRQGLVRTWTDRQIDGGSNWRADIEQALTTCDLALLLMSPAFLASDFVQTVEMARLLERKERGDIRVVPIILKPCMWKLTGMNLLALPKDGRPIITLEESTGARDQAWAEIGQQIAAWAKDFHAAQSVQQAGSALAYLETSGIGPAESLVLEPASRLTLITGDNGLGKSFLLECAWWALTGMWAERPAYPSPGSAQTKTDITFDIGAEPGGDGRQSIAYDWETLSWPQPESRPTVSALALYARVDGSFAVWDPTRQARQFSAPSATRPGKAMFSNDEVWNGRPGEIEGLIRDWVLWQNNPAKYPFETFTKVLARLSPPDLGLMEPGELVRIPGDSREIPTIKHPYGTTPVVYASAGVRRVVTLAYLAVWAWNEHVAACRLARAEPQRSMVILVDEMEAHLHPRWQRTVLPALMSISEMLAPQLAVQYIIATHSPLVMASAETVFDAKADSLVHLGLDAAGKVSLRQLEFIPFGDVSAWLTSPVFELLQARSREAETAIQDAKALQMQPTPASDAVREVSGRLTRFLAHDDRFWPRWVAFAERHGVQL